MQYRLLGKLLLFAALALAALAVRAENAQDFGDYVVHYNALTTDMIPPEVARQYGIKRSKSRAMLNIVVLKKIMGTGTEPMTARVTASATNLTGQKKRIDLRLIREAHAIYYIGEFGISNQETLDFDIEVTPEGSKQPLHVRFRHEFFTN